LAHLFISHSTRDGGAIAQQLAAALEAAGHRCWIAPRDVKPGVPYPGQIVAAIRDSAGLVLIVTPAANESPDVLQEVQLAGQNRKTVAPVIVGGAKPSDDLHYFIGVRHQIAWSDARAATTELLRSFPAPGAGAAPANPLARQFAETLANISAQPADSGELFDVFMLMPGEHKINVIKVVREYTGWGLAETKLIVEGFPPVRVGMSMPRSRAEEMVRNLKSVGATMMDLVKAKT
jgi:ribosomal protein L7/L12